MKGIKGFQKGNQLWRKANHRGHKPTFQQPHTEEARRKMSEHWKRIGCAKGFLGGHHSIEARRKMSLARRGSKHWNWKSGLTELVRGIRRSPEFYQWRKAVLERDNYTCQDCGKTEGIEAHHIRAIMDYPEGIFEVKNGLTVCGDCHKRHTFWQGLRRVKQ